MRFGSLGRHKEADRVLVVSVVQFLGLAAYWYVSMGLGNIMVYVLAGSLLAFLLGRGGESTDVRARETQAI